MRKPAGKRPLRTPLIGSVLFILALALGFVSSSAYAASCPDGSYVAGDTCFGTPDGGYVSGDSGYGDPQMAPDGSYVSGTPGSTPEMAPDGSYVGGGAGVSGCPDGSYVSGSCGSSNPDGSYTGQ